LQYQCSEGLAQKEKMMNTRCHAFILGPGWGNSVGVLIVLNALYLGLCVNDDMRVAVAEYHGDTTNALLSESQRLQADIFFVSVFSMELLVRMLAFQDVFLFGRGWKWNWLDILVVFSSVVELSTPNNSNYSFLRVLRALRMVKTVQVLRRHPFFFKFRLMLLALFSTITSFFWAVLLVISCMALFSVMFVQSSAVYLESGETSEDTAEVLVTFWHSVPMGVLTLYMGITGGVNWWDLQRAFMDFSPFCSGVYVLYQAFMALAFLNIVTGVFVNESIEVAQNDRELRAISLIRQRKGAMNYLRDLFREIDADGSGAITQDEFVQALDDTKIKVTLENLGVELYSAVELFAALDISGDQRLEIDEFVMGLVAFSASNRDMDLLKHQNNKIVTMLRQVLSK